jgi:hypothetical protein
MLVITVHKCKSGVELHTKGWHRFVLLLYLIVQRIREKSVHFGLKAPNLVESWGWTYRLKFAWDPNEKFKMAAIFQDGRHLNCF